MDAEPAALSVAAMLRSLGDERATGCLRLERGGTQGRVWLRDGQVYTAAAPEARPRLGDRLVGAEQITEDQLEAALQLQRSLPQAPRIGELLISTGLIDRETMTAYVRDQILDSVAAVLGWSDGDWSFQPGEEVPEDVSLDMSTENLLMDATRRLEEFEVIRARLGSLDAVVDFAGTGQADLALTPDEWAMLTRIDGSSSVRDLAESSGYSQLETARIVYGLLTAGVVQIVDRGATAESSAQPEAAEQPEPEAAEQPEPEAAEQPEPEAAEQPEPEAAEQPEAPDRFDGLEELEGLGWPESPGPDQAAPEPPAPKRKAQPTDVDRHQLLREFSRLEDDTPPSGAEPPPPPRRRPQSRQGQSRSRPQENPDDKRGLFGRFRRG